jgi:hypothetical protein
MDKEKVLAMSREEYEYEDLAEREACEKGAVKTHVLLFYICMGLFVLDFLFGNRINAGYLLIITLDNAIKYRNKALVSKKKTDWICFILLIFAAIVDVIIMVVFYCLYLKTGEDRSYIEVLYLWTKH